MVVELDWPGGSPETAWKNYILYCPCSLISKSCLAESAAQSPASPTCASGTCRWCNLTGGRWRTAPYVGAVLTIRQAFFDALRARGSAWANDDLKLIGVALLEQLRKRKAHEADVNKRTKKIKQRRQELKTKLEAVEERQSEAGSHQEDLETLNSGLAHKFLARLDVTNQECERLQRESQTIKNEASRCLKSRDEIVQIFSDQGVPGVSYRSLSRWSNGDCMGQPGRMTVFDEEAETLLVQTILRLDEAGVPMGESEICSGPQPRPRGPYPYKVPCTVLHCKSEIHNCKGMELKFFFYRLENLIHE